MEAGADLPAAGAAREAYAAAGAAAGAAGACVCMRVGVVWGVCARGCGARRACKRWWAGMSVWAQRGRCGRSSCAAPLPA